MSDAARQQREEALRRAVLAGDEAAWRVWYDETYDAVTRFVLWRLRGRSEGREEVLQETWLITVKRIGDFDPRQGTFLDWVRGIAGNVVKNHLRKSFATSAAPLNQDVAQRRPTAAVDNSSQSDRIVEVLQFLPDRYAAVLKAKYLEQQSVAEIASSWNETSKAIESLLTRARQAFRDAFGMDHSEREA